MIHQFIFAGPKPGMSEAEFQRYWLEIHAVRFAGKIPQIRRYKIDTRIDSTMESEYRLGSGVAEIWLENEQEQLASLQTPEFLQGARLDEPNWAAFWRSIVLDTTAHTLLEGPPASRDSTWVKLFVCVKRKPGMSLDMFRKYGLETHGPKILKIAGLRRYQQCHVRDGAYSVGEPILDSVSMLWFDNLAAIDQLANDPYVRTVVAPDLANFVDPKYVHRLVAGEHWVIGPELRYDAPVRMVG